MKVYLVWYIDPYNPIQDVVEVFSTEEKAEQYINAQPDKDDYTFEEKEVN
jgi:hypothetical protein